jgi:hypothetical protein
VVSASSISLKADIAAVALKVRFGLQADDLDD